MCKIMMINKTGQKTQILYDFFFFFVMKSDNIMQAKTFIKLELKLHGAQDDLIAMCWRSRTMKIR